VSAENASAFRLVTGLFLRRFVDNDLLSPHADRHESLAVLYACVVSLAVFVTFFLSTTYLSAFIQLPGTAALSALGDRFLYVGGSITISALAALMGWDALALELRDAAILGPLPIPARTITRAKLAAAIIFGTVLTIGLNAVPSVLYPLFLTLNIRGTRGSTVLRLIGGHATTVALAGCFGFFGVLALRGTLRLLLGERRFHRVSSGVQSALTVGMVTGLLLVPTVRAHDVQAWVARATPPAWVARPVLWYLALNETLAGHLVSEIPVVLPPRFSSASYPKQEDELARATYRSLLPRFVEFVPLAWLALLGVTSLAFVTFLWTNRRYPGPSVGVLAESRLGGCVRRLVERRTSKDPEAEAGFFFALQTLARSGPHRTIVAIAVAVGLTHMLIVLAQRQAPAVGQPTPLGVFGIAILLLASLLAGFSRAVAVPAEPVANWMIRMAWLGDERGFLVGVKRAALVAFVAVPLILLLPLHVFLLGVVTAVAHTLFASCFAMLALDALLLSYRKFPFACSYVPVENPKIVWPAALVSLLLVTYGYAALERWALQLPTRTTALAAGLVAMVLFVKALDRLWRRERRPVVFDDRPRQATQRLDLFERVAIYE
jgi:hypothetical protein